MIPISDTADRRSGFPLFNVTFIVLNVIVFLYQVTLATEGRACTIQFQGERGFGSPSDCFTFMYAAVPAQITQGVDLPPGNTWPLWSTLLTSMFMHGGWSHLIGNMAYLWVFGDNIEDTLGHLGYLLFYLVCGVLAAAAHILSDPLSDTPTLGASGAISGVLGAYLVMFPGNQVNTLVILGFFFRVIALPAILVLGFWIVLQLFNGVIGAGGAGGGVAYWAHIGGFFAGMVLILPARIFSRRRRPNRFY